MSSKKDNPHSVSSILESTPRSKSKKGRKRRLHTESLAESQVATVPVATSDDNSAGARSAGCVILTEFMKVAGSIPDVKCRLLDRSSIESAESTLEVTPATCSVTQLGPMDVVRLVVSGTSGLCQFQVMYPVPRCVDQLKCESS